MLQLFKCVFLWLGLDELGLRFTFGHLNKGPSNNIRESQNKYAFFGFQIYDVIIYLDNHYIAYVLDDVLLFNIRLLCVSIKCLFWVIYASFCLTIFLRIMSSLKHQPVNWFSHLKQFHLKHKNKKGSTNRIVDWLIWHFFSMLTYVLKYYGQETSK